jgi:alkanesulfonate monooxygenase SsuD/methylene tetrahydromethanopterin reductase-like flavin-dependent oxidoreductase (luciferase family)
MDFGVGLMGYHGCWDDAAFAEDHGFSSAGFVDSPLIGGDPFVCLALAARATRNMRLGTFLAVPSLRQAATTASAIATVNKLAPGRTFLAMGTGFTGRAVFGLPRISTTRLREYALQCRGLLDGDEVVHREGGRERPIRFGHTAGRYVDTENRIPVLIAADGPKALAVAGEVGDGWVVTLQYSNVMQNAADVFAGSWAQVQEAAALAGRALDGAYTMYSACVCVLEPGESAVSERALEQVGMAAMMPFHAYADNPAIGEYLPPPLRDRLEIYEREVQGRFGVGRDRYHQETHRGHLSHILEGEAEVLTDEIVRMTTLTGTAEEIARTLAGLEAAGLDNISFWAPPHLTREIVLDIETKVMPLMATAAV